MQKTSHYLKTSRHLAVRPEELPAIRRAFWARPLVPGVGCDEPTDLERTPHATDPEASGTDAGGVSRTSHPADFFEGKGARREADKEKDLQDDVICSDYEFGISNK